jgi:hypothetical protein
MAVRFGLHSELNITMGTVQVVKNSDCLPVPWGQVTNITSGGVSVIE